MDTVPRDLVEKLYTPLPPQAIEAHPSKSYLSTIKTIYQVERLNEVFGIGGWKAKSEVVEQNTADGKAPGMIVMKVTLYVPAYGIELEQYGGNDNVDRGDAYKGAFTDALSKICGYIGIGIDVYKGDGPTKANPRGSKAASNAIRDRKVEWAEESKAKRAAKEPLPPEPELEPEPPTQLQEELAESITQAKLRKPKKDWTKFEILGLFREMKKRYEALDSVSDYYKVLGMYGMEKSNDFEDDDAGREKARKAYKHMQLNIQDLEAYYKKQQEETQTHAS